MAGGARDGVQGRRPPQDEDAAPQLPAVLRRGRGAVPLPRGRRAVRDGEKGSESRNDQHGHL